MNRFLPDGCVDNFSFRDGETLHIPTPGSIAGCKYAVMFAKVPPIPSPVGQRSDGATVEAVAVIAAQLVDDEWRWLHLSAQAKEVIACAWMDLCDRNVWHGLAILASAAQTTGGAN